ncbi:MAG: tRNA uridine-5-carboxymethylaminomethyl(34) synthesis GTPase MnmE [Sphingomonadales bacterium]|nr:tRNA uridine-5-carboxymethylaminomethyl(34) synthesis GTPase MnmE [Sphingomonadales bacterium]
MSDTIFALSSGAPPAAIAVVRISGPDAALALTALAGRKLPPRKAVTVSLHNADGALLDRALGLWLPGPATATGEDTLELHCHGGRAVVAAVEAALARVPGLRRAEAGEFTRRAFTNGRIDLAEAEGLADLLASETEVQRQTAMAMVGGVFSRQIGQWRERLLGLSAAVEAVLDFADEDDVSALPEDFVLRLTALREEIALWLDRPRAEVLREGFRVVLAGPPNAGKSTLFNALVESDAAITAPVAGTTRDVLTHPVAISGIPFRFVDTAGLRDAVGDTVEAIGVERARAAADAADLILWLGPEGQGPEQGLGQVWEIEAQVDVPGHARKRAPRHRLSAIAGDGMNALRGDLVATARAALPRPGEAALSMRQHRLIAEAAEALASAEAVRDPLLVAEGLRLTRVAFDALLGRTTTEDMLDALFGRFCIGK